MLQPESRHYIETNHFREGARRGWERVGPADDILTLDIADFVKLDGDLPDGSGPRSNLFSVPPMRVTPGGPLVDTALEVHIPAEDLGVLALRRWKDALTTEDTRRIGADILRGLACSDRSFWEIPTILQSSQMFPAKAKIAEGFVAVSTTAGKSFEEANLSLVFYYDSKGALFAHTQIDTWISDVSRYLVHRGLPEALMAALGEHRGFYEMIGEPRPNLPIPPLATHEESFEDLLPESLVRREYFHGRHPQLSFGRFVSQLRVPTHVELSPDFTPVINQSAIVKELMRSGFAVSWVSEDTDRLSRTPSSGPQSLADIIPKLPSLFGRDPSAAPEEPNSYWGPYLHIVAEHGDSIPERLEAIGGALILIYRFKDYITGLERL